MKPGEMVVGIVPGAILFTASGSGLATLYRRNPLIALGFTLAVISFVLLVHRRIKRDSAAQVGSSDPSRTS